MVGKEDASGSWGQYQVSNNAPKKFWRSASWSSSRTMPSNPDNEEKDSIDPNGNARNNNAGQARRFPALLTPRSQQNCKARSCLPPLQPLAIARRSLDEWPKAGSDDIGEWPGPPTPGARDVIKFGEKLKVDLSAIEKSSDGNGELVKRDKIAFYNKECSKVAEHIYLGGDAVARDRDILKRNGITHVLNCVGFVCPEYFKADFVYRTLWLQDSPSEDITSILYDVFDYFEDVKEQKGRVFIHCCQGVSRSTSLVIAYLMWREGQSFDDAFQYVKEARGIADPNMGFACQLLQCQKRVHAVPLSPSSLFRMYRITPHSSYDPLHLVPKLLNDPSPLALDSRGAFIIQVPSAIYIWLGKKCEVIMERDAREIVCQIMRYERVQAVVHVIKEGNEPSFFWDAFSETSVDKPDNGELQVESSGRIHPEERKVDLYDVDFEIFHKAIMGGFVPPFSSMGAEHETHLPARENSWSSLRCKFVSRHVKEFVSAPKLVINKLQSDSRIIDSRDSIVKPSHIFDASSMSSSSPSSLSSSSVPSSLSSPSHLSPDSISSDSSTNSKHFSDPVSDSFANMSLVSSKTSLSVSNHPEYIEVNFDSQPLPISSRRSPLSIAERRGSLSKCLTLPIVADERRMKDTLQDNPAHEQSCGQMNKTSCISFDFNKGANSTDFRNDDSEVSVDAEKLNSSVDERESALTNGSDILREKSFLRTSKNLNEPIGMLAVGAANLELKRPLVYRLPGLEMLSTIEACDLDSESAFVCISPSTLEGLSDNMTVYLWIGRSFKLVRPLFQANKQEVGDVVSTDWCQIGSHVLTQINLSEDTDIKIVKEGDEPVDFLALLNIL